MSVGLYSSLLCIFAKRKLKKYSTMRLTKTLLTLLLLLCTVPSWAVPARRVSITVEQPDGTQLVLTMRGDEHFHCLVTADGVPVVRYEGAYYYALIGDDGSMESSELLAHEADLRTEEETAFLNSLPDMRAVYAERATQMRARRRASAAAEAEQMSEVPTRGNVCVPILLVQYADVKFANSKAALENHINGEGYKNERGYGSIREYFIDQSEGAFTPQFDIIGPITLDNRMDFYGGNDEDGNDLRPREMVEEACRKAYASRGVDFTRYDNNGDGHVDILYVIYAGYGEASHPDMLENTIWPHQWNLEAPLKLGGVSINRYACNNELEGYRGTVLGGIGTFCHEFSHCLGLPDFYDTSESPSGFGLKSWSLMDYGCYNNNGHTPCGYTGYEKDYLGWKKLVVLNDPADIVLKPLSEGGTAYKIVNDANPNEYYVLENHKKSKWDSYAPGEGMLVLHVDYSEEAWYENTLNNNPTHQRLTIIPADNMLTVETLGGDVYPGSSMNTSLTSKSKPSAKVYTGGFMGKDITHITQRGDDVCFSFMKDAPVLHGASDITATGFSVSWAQVDGVREYEVRLELLKEKESLLPDDSDYHSMTIYTARTMQTSFRFENLDGGLYRASVRSVRDDAFSSYSNMVDVEIIDTQFPPLDLTIGCEIDDDSIYLTIDDAEAAIYYTLDGTTPTAYAHRYTGPFELKEKATLQLMARKEGYRRTECHTYCNWFAQEGLTYRIQSTLSPKVVLSAAMGGNSASDYAGHIVIADEVTMGSLAYQLVGIEQGAFRDATSLRSVTIESNTVESIGDELFYGCSALNAVVWNTALPITAAMFDGTSYYNLLIYVPQGTTLSHPLIEDGRIALVVDGKAATLRLYDKKTFYCPRSFVAEEVMFQRDFTQATEMGTSAGWETIVLPFEVQRFTHSHKGAIAPFGVEAQYHFWLARLGNGGFEQSTTLSANTPYIIAMPNHAEYGDYSLNGVVTFAANQATIHATEEVVVAKSRELNLTPSYENIAVNSGIYVLNVGSAYESYKAGSVFVPNHYVVNPFTAYAAPSAGTRAMPFYRIQSQPEVEEAAVDSPIIESRDGNIYISVTEPQLFVVYDAVGRVVCRVACEAGVNVIPSLAEGMYLINKTKVYVHR